MIKVKNIFSLVMTQASKIARYKIEIMEISLLVEMSSLMKKKHEIGMLKKKIMILFLLWRRRTNKWKLVRDCYSTFITTSINSWSSNNIIFIGKFKWEDTMFYKFIWDLWGNRKLKWSIFYFSINYELIIFEEVIQNWRWKDVMGEEIKSIRRNDIWELKPLSNGKKDN